MPRIISRWLVVALAIIGFGMFGCATCDRAPKYTERSASLGEGLNMTVEQIVQIDEEGEYFTQIIVAFKHDSSFSHIIQEIVLDSGSSLVECFRGGEFFNVYDLHSWGVRPHSRKMKVYLGNVEGTDERNGFAHLPHNFDKTLFTTVGKNFNKNYQETHETRGKITSVGKEWLEWSIADDGEYITVRTKDGEWRFRPRG